MTHFDSNYRTPGWQRAQARGRAGGAGGGFEEDADDYSAHDQTTGGAATSPSSARGRNKGFAHAAQRRGGPLTIEGELVAKSTGTVSAFAAGDRVFHQKFGNGNEIAVDGNKLTIAFDRAGEKRVVDSFVERV